MLVLTLSLYCIVTSSCQLLPCILLSTRIMYRLSNMLYYIGGVAGPITPTAGRRLRDVDEHAGDSE
jgi:hypothetical protein